MWYIRYAFTDQKTGKPAKVSSLLETGVVYTIGSHDDASFPINSPKVAGTHIRFEVDDKNYPFVSPHLRLQVIGRSAIINNETIDLTPFTEKERLQQKHMAFFKSLTLKIGKLGIKIRISNRLVLIRPAKESHIDTEKLKSLGIIYDQKLTERTTHLIAEPSNYSSTVLNALIRQVEVIPESYIQEIINRKQLLLENFEENYPRVEDFLFDQAYKQNPLRETIFDNIVFIFGESKQFETFGEILQGAKATVILYEFPNNATVDKLTEFIKNQTPEGFQFVLVKLQTTQNNDFLTSVYNPDGQEYQNLKLMNEASKTLGVYLASNEEIFNAVKDLNIEPLFRKRPNRSSSFAPVPTADQPQLKKARRSKFKQLDSLDFFVGGGKTENAKQESIPATIPESESLTQPADLKVDSQEPPRKKQRSRFKAAPNLMIENYSSVPEAPELEVKDPHTEPEKPKESPEKEPSSVTQDPDDDLPEEQVPETQESPIVPKKETQAFSSAVLEAKKKNDARFNDELGVGEELDEHAVIQLQNLAIVEAFEIKPRGNIPIPSQSNSNAGGHDNWKNRKNFKVFVKNSSNSKNKNASFNHSFREYISFKEFNPHEDDKVSKETEEMLDHIEREKQLERGNNREETFSFRNQSAGQSGYSTLRQPTVVDVRKKSTGTKLFVESDDEDGADEGFRFTNGDGYTENDGLGMNVRPTTLEDVPEFRRNVQREPTEVERQLQNLNKKAVARNITPIQQENDDEDDDDVPRFRFRT